ncbi:MAG: type II toxin-antitoxin system RelE/ParE family toxin [Terracidiphilus sp.]
MKPFKFHPAAWREIKTYHAWYARQSVQAADGFYEELLPALDRVLLRPSLYPPYLYSTQRVVLGRYPFYIVYRELLHDIQIIAVAHAKRRPGYWATRLQTGDEGIL